MPGTEGVDALREEVGGFKEGLTESFGPVGVHAASLLQGAKHRAAGIRHKGSSFSGRPAGLLGDHVENGARFGIQNEIRAVAERKGFRQLRGTLHPDVEVLSLLCGEERTVTTFLTFRLVFGAKEIRTKIPGVGIEFDRELTRRNQAHAAGHVLQSRKVRSAKEVRDSRPGDLAFVLRQAGRRVPTLDGVQGHEEDRRQKLRRTRTLQQYPFDFIAVENPIRPQYGF